MIRYQVFVSSTYKDLKQERSIIKKAVLEKRCFPAGMEEFPAVDKKQFEYIQRVLDDSDYYILVLGGSVGSICEETKESYTYMEYQYAKSKKIPIIVFVKKDSKDKIVCKEKESDRIDYYNKFVENVSANRMCSFFYKKEELSGLVHSSLDEAFKEMPRAGWKKAECVELVNDETLLLKGRILEYFVIGNDIYDCDGEFYEFKNYGQVKKNIVVKYGLDTQDAFKMILFVGEQAFNLYYEVEEDYLINGYLKDDIKMQISLARLGNLEEVLLFFSVGNLKSEMTTKVYRFGETGIHELGEINGQEYMYIDYDLMVPYGSQGLYDSYVYCKKQLYKLMERV